MNSCSPKVSVIIPAYNVERCLEQCLDSVFRQSLAPWQVIVINDGSDDATGETIQGYRADITYVEQKNQGQGAARNAGLDLATGEYIAFLDADDYWLEHFLKTCVTFLEEHGEVIAVSTGLTIKSADGCERIWPRCLQAPDVRWDGPIMLEDFFSFWAEHDHVRTGSNVIRASVIRQAGGQRADLRISQDMEYWGYIATFGKWAFVPKLLWVGNSRAASGASWWEKYRHRRRLCPSVEAWQQRIVPRLKIQEISSFEIVRGRVAAGFAHSKILAGDWKGALDTVRRYGDSMPQSRLVLLMRTGAKWGGSLWSLTCGLIVLKEYLKSWRLHLRARMRR